MMIQSPLMVSHNILIKRLNAINKRIQKSAKSSNRNHDNITLIAATKTQPTIIWETLIKTNVFNIGENKIQETIKKTHEFSQRKKIKLHLIGHLQKNKIKKAIETYDVIQTVDGIVLGEKINRISGILGKKQEIYMQINITKDPKKYGMMPEEAYKNAIKIIKMENVDLTGIMTIPKQGMTKKDLSNIYGELKNIRDKIQMKISRKCKNISMGMSNDYEIAIKEGATHIRLGTALFGKR